MNNRIKVNYKSIVTYSQVDTSEMSYEGFKEGRLLKGKYVDNKRMDGLSPSARKRLKKRLSVFLSSVEGYRSYVLLRDKLVVSKANFLSFLTLTLPSVQVGDDKEVKQMLDRFIVRSQRKHGLLFTYLWISEKQRNGNLHFHIVCDGFYEKSDLRNCWNKILGNYGYLDAFEKRHGHRNPPSTRVDGTSKGLERYLTKYLSKSEQKKGVVGCLWRSSVNLTKFEEYSNDEDVDEAYLSSVEADDEVSMFFPREEFSFMNEVFYGKGFNPLNLKYSEVIDKVEYYKDIFKSLYMKRLNYLSNR